MCATLSLAGDVRAARGRRRRCRRESESSNSKQILMSCRRSAPLLIWHSAAGQEARTLSLSHRPRARWQKIFQLQHQHMVREREEKIKSQVHPAPHTRAPCAPKWKKHKFPIILVKSNRTLKILPGLSPLPHKYARVTGKNYSKCQRLYPVYSSATLMY